MTTQSQRAQTTSTDQPHDLTERLVSMLEHPAGKLQEIVRHIGLGADLHNECGTFASGQGGDWESLTALSLAVLVDAACHQLLLTPLLLAHGGDIGQVDSMGRTLMSFAWQGPVAAYLQDHGTPSAPGAAEAVAAMMEAGEFEVVREEPLVPDDEVRDLAPDWLRVELDTLGFFNPEAAGTFPTFNETHPLIARFSAARMLSDAVYARDATLVKRLIELGGHTVDLRHDYDVERDGVTYYFRDITTLALAVLIDGEAGGDDGAGEAEGEPCIVPLFALVTDFEGQHDDDGNTLLHMAKAPRMAEWLIRFGLSRDVANHSGELPLAVAPPRVRSAIERALYDMTLPVSDAVVDAAVRRRL